MPIRPLPIPTLTNTTQGEEIRREQSSREDMSPQEGQSERKEETGERDKDKQNKKAGERSGNAEAER